MPQAILSAFQNGIKGARPSKDTRGRVKSSKRKYGSDAYVVDEADSAIAKMDAFDNVEIDENETDEFDSMTSSDSLSKRLGIDSSSDFLQTKKKRKFFDDLSDDEDYFYRPTMNDKYLNQSHASSSKFKNSQWVQAIPNWTKYCS